MKYLLSLFALLCLLGCDERLLGPDDHSGMNITLPSTYIEWESIHPQDTTWWTFCATGVVMAAYKVKITGVSGAPPWDPMCIGTDKYGNCVPELNKNGDTLNELGQTHAQYIAYWAAQIAGWLPIKYYEGTWGENLGIVTVNVNQCVPGQYMNCTCDMNNPTYITTGWAPIYWNYSTWDKDSLSGYQCDESGNRVPLQHSSYNLKLIRWYGQQLFDLTNPIFRQ